MATVIGIDEAGLGPVLGPLVVSAAAFEVPDEAHDASLWRQLSGAVTRRPDARGRALAIADSKRLYAGRRGARGLYHLERAVLSGCRVAGGEPRSLRQLLDGLAPQAGRDAAAYPWYRDLELELPLSTTAEELDEVSLRLRRRMEKAGVRLLGIRCIAVFELEFNTLIAQHGTKAAVNFEAAARLLRAARRDFPETDLVVHLDRHGGRRRYLELLDGLWPTSWIWIEDESPTSSSYLVEDGGRTLRISFTVGCEQLQLPVALASMVSKYLRELLMERFNAFWTSRLPGLEPTAGYPLDGKRFWRQIEPHLSGLGLGADWVYRCR